MRVARALTLVAAMTAMGCTLLFPVDDYDVASGPDDGGAVDAQDAGVETDAGARSVAVELTLSREFVRVARGTVVNLQFSVEVVGREGEVVVQALDLPSGTRSDPVTLAAGVTEGTLALAASPDAPPTATPAEVRFTATLVGTEAVDEVPGTIVVAGLPARPDASFGDDGEVRVAIAEGELAFPYDVAVDSAGRIVIVGSGGVGASFAVRLDAEGNVDPTFASGGFLTEVAGFEIREMLLTTAYHDGVLIYANGMRGAESGHAVFLLNDAGLLDTSFGESGFVFLPTSVRRLLAARTDGSLYVGGAMETRRILPDGTLDPSYGEGGVQMTEFASVGVLDPEERMLLARPGTGIDPTAMVTRHLSSGAVDTSFGTDGTVPLPVEEPRSADAWVGHGAANDERVVFANRVHPNGTSPRDTVRSLLFSLTPDGQPTPGFGVDGVVTLMLDGANVEVFAVALQSDNRVLVLAHDRESSSSDRFLMRLSADGTPDTTFAPIDLQGSTAVVVDQQLGRVLAVHGGFLNEIRVFRHWL